MDRQTTTKKHPHWPGLTGKLQRYCGNQILNAAFDCSKEEMEPLPWCRSQTTIRQKRVVLIVGSSAKTMWKRSCQPQCLPFSTQSHCRCRFSICTEKPRPQRSLVCTKPLKIKRSLLTEWNKSTVACCSTMIVLNIKALWCGNWKDAALPRIQRNSSES